MRAEDLVELLGDLLDDHVISADFLDRPIDAHIAQIRADLGLSASEPSPPRAKSLVSFPNTDEVPAEANRLETPRALDLGRPSA